MAVGAVVRACLTPSVCSMLYLVYLALTLLCATQLPSVQGAALTTQVGPHDRSCFYAWVDKAGEKVGFYFAVQAGGTFEIDYEVMSPSDKRIVEGRKERQLDVIFTGNEVGEYSFCFENDMSTFADKTVRIDTHHNLLGSNLFSRSTSTSQ